MEANPNYRSDDYIAPLLLPSGLRPFLNISLAGRLFTKAVAPKGIYEYVIARTKYIDTVFRQALAEQLAIPPSPVSLVPDPCTKRGRHERKKYRLA
jgi:hypothetical protein